MTFPQWYDEYAGDWHYVKDMWPFNDISRTEHSHYAFCGGQYDHAHKGGSVPHRHRHQPCDYCRKDS